MSLGSTETGTLSTSRLWRAILVMLLGFFVSGVLGIARTAVIAAKFGTSTAADAFNAALQLPELIFVLVAGGALGSAFVPVFARLRQEDEAAAWQLSRSVLTLSAGAALALSIAIILVAPYVVPILESGASHEQQRLTTELTQWMMLTPCVFSISGILMSILQSYGRFTLPALAIGMNNLGYIFGALVLAERLPPDSGLGQVGSANVFGLALGAILSAGLHLLVQLPGLKGLGGKFMFSGQLFCEGVSDVVKLMVPRVFGLAVVRINYLVNILLTSQMIAGSRTALSNAFVFVFFVIGLIGQSVGTAVFPTLAATHHSGEAKVFRERLAQALRGALLLSIPCMVGLILLSEILLSVLLERGVWNSSSTIATAWALRFYAIGLPAFAIIEVLSRAFYALEDTRTPVLFGALAMFANIGLSLILIEYFGDPASLERGPFAGLALANALTTSVEALILTYILQLRVRGSWVKELIAGVLKMVAAAGVMGVLVYLTLRVMEQYSDWLNLLLGILTGIVSYLIISLILKLDEITQPINMLMRKLHPN